MSDIRMLINREKDIRITIVSFQRDLDHELRSHKQSMKVDVLRKTIDDLRNEIRKIEQEWRDSA